MVLCEKEKRECGHCRISGRCARLLALQGRKREAMGRGKTQARRNDFVTVILLYRRGDMGT